MIKKATIFLVAFIAAIPMFAQWTKPSLPAKQALAVDKEVYLFNAGAEGFFLGAYDWSTRASVSPTRGYRVTIEKYVTESNPDWDGKSYYITSYVEDGAPAGQTLCTFISGWDNIWVDRAKTDPEDKAFVFEPQTNGNYRICLSPQNREYNAEAYEGAYLGIIPSRGDTRIYLCDPYAAAYEFSSCLIDWYFVSTTDYTAYVSALKQYNAAKDLGDAIADAEKRFPTVDISSAKGVYNNTSSTEAELKAAKTALTNLLMDYATPEATVDLTERVTNPSYDNNDNTGWAGTAPGFQQYGNAEFFNKTYDYHQALALAPGVYRVGVTAYYRAGDAEADATALKNLKENGEAPQNAKLYVNTALHSPFYRPLPFASTGATDETMGDDTSTNEYGIIPNNMHTGQVYFDAGKYQPTVATCMVGEDGALTIGLKKETTIANDWTLFDNWTLTYLGNNTDAYNEVREEYLSFAPDYEELIASGKCEYYQHAAYDAYLAAKKALLDATTAEQMAKAITAYDEATQTLQISVDAYNAYYEKFCEANDFFDERSDELMGDGMMILGDYLGSDEGPSPEYPDFVNGGAMYILENGPLSAEEVTQEIKLLEGLLETAIANGMSDGTDCTSMIKNPHFETEGGWTKEGLAEYPKGTDTYKLAEAFTILFNVYQTFTGLQNGLYELSLNDFFRPADFGNYTPDGYRAYVYLNGFEQKMNLIDNGAVDEQLASDDAVIDGKYVPNSVTGAAAAFEAGRYKQVIYGLVTDGTMKIGVRNDLRYENCWGVWSDFKLIFRAKNPQVLAEVLAASLPQAKEKLNNKCGNEDIETLKAAIQAAESNPSDAYQALVDLKVAMDGVDESTTNYTLLNNAISNAEQTLTDYANQSTQALKELHTLTEQAKAGYQANTYNKDEAAQMIVDLNSAVVAVKIPGGGNQEEQDVTSLIVNPTFDPARGSKDDGTIEGWTTSAMNGYKENTVSYNRAGITLYQTLSGLPKGKYKVTVHTYYRAGYADEDYALWQEDQKKSHLTTLYAKTSENTFETPVMNLCEDAQSEQVNGSKCDQLSNGLYVPNGTSATVIWFNAGYYLNTLEFTVPEDGTVTIGLEKTEVLPNDYEVVGAWNLYYYGDDTQEEKRDVTALIVNPTFDPARGSKDDGTIEGWTTSAMNGYKENTVSYNRAGITLYQTLSGLPAGEYDVTVHTYYRAGYADEDYALWQEDQNKSHLTTLYAKTSENTFEIPVMNLCEDAQSEQVNGSKCDQLSNGLYVPNGTSATVIWFNAGYYLNTLHFTVPEDGTVTIGLEKTEVLPNDYEVVGAWNLYYYGKSTAIDELLAERIHKSNNMPEGYYTINGARLTAPQKGINIVKMADGTVKKIFVR
ncbi:MAG: hypothetical protein IKH26_14245 [Bacteroidaceae bacterium]|nr:hypothetical protein [Bacteroidaceae bacterium]